MQTIQLSHHPAAEKLDLAVALLFPRGQRPTLAEIRSLSLQQGQFAVTLESAPGSSDRQWVELLANGLTFDLAGLAPGPGVETSGAVHLFGLADDFDAAACEGLLLTPGPHLVSGGPMVPVLRCLAWLAAELALLDGVQAVMWKPARSLCGPDWYRDTVTRWIAGGAFPGLGLTALLPQDDGSLQSEGLRMFTGQEMVLDADIARDRSQAAKLAVRLLHWLVENGRVDETMSLTGPSGETLILEPQREHGIVWVWRGSR